MKTVDQSSDIRRSAALMVGARIVATCRPLLLDPTLGAQIAEDIAEAVLAAAEEVDSLRAKLAESEAATAVLAQFIREEETHSLSCVSAAINGRCDCQFRTDNEERSAALANLPASVLSHMEEDAALREVAAKGACPDCCEQGPFAMVTDMTKDPPDQGECTNAYHAAVAHLDAVRAKGGG